MKHLPIYLVIVLLLVAELCHAAVDPLTTTQQEWTADTIADLAAKAGPRVGQPGYVRDVDTGTAGLQGARFIAVPLGTFSTSSMHTFVGVGVEWADDYTIVTSFATALPLATTSTPGLQSAADKTYENALVAADIITATNRTGSLPNSRYLVTSPTPNGITLDLGLDPTVVAIGAPFGSPVAVGTANADGTAGGYARSDHQHNLPFSVLQTVLGGASGAVSFNGQSITSVANPTNATDAANKYYVDLTSAGFSIKGSVAAMSTSNIASMSGLATVIDGITFNIDGMRELSNGQSTASQNGIWLVHSGAWTRATDMAAASNAAGAFVPVTGGTTYGGYTWACNTPNGSAVVGTNNITFTQFSSPISVITDAQHGNRGGGPLHPVATSSQAGFLSAWSGVANAVPNTNSSGTSFGWTTGPTLGAAAIGYVLLGTSGFASAGLARLPNNQSINWRNAGSTADIGITVNASDRIVLGGAAFPASPGSGDVGKLLGVTAANTYANQTLATWGIATGVSTTGALGLAPLVSANNTVMQSNGSTWFGSQITDPQISSTAAIAPSKIAACASGQTIIGGASNSCGTLSYSSLGSIPANINTGTGTSGTFAKFTGTSTVGNSSNLSESGSLVSSSGAIRAAGEIQSTSVISGRQVQGSYGVFWDFDGTSVALRRTVSGDQYGSFASALPFFWDLPTNNMSFSSGALSITSGNTNVAGTLAVNGGSPAAGKIAYATDSSGTIGWKTEGVTTVNKTTNIYPNANTGQYLTFDSSFWWYAYGTTTSNLTISCSDWSACTYPVPSFRPSGLLEIELVFHNAGGDDTTFCREKIYASLSVSETVDGTAHYYWYKSSGPTEKTAERVGSCASTTTPTVTLSGTGNTTITIGVSVPAAATLMTVKARVFGSAKY